MRGSFLVIDKDLVITVNLAGVLNGPISQGIVDWFLVVQVARDHWGGWALEVGNRQQEGAGGRVNTKGLQVELGDVDRLLHVAELAEVIGTVAKVGGPEEGIGGRLEGLLGGDDPTAGRAFLGQPQVTVGAQAG